MSEQAAANVGMAVDAPGTIENAIGVLDTIIDEAHAIAGTLHDALGVNLVDGKVPEVAQPSPLTSVDILINQLDELHRRVRYLNERLNQAVVEANRLRNN